MGGLQVVAVVEDSAEGGALGGVVGGLEVVDPALGVDEVGDALERGGLVLGEEGTLDPGAGAVDKVVG